jgi:hypothetical protein
MKTLHACLRNTFPRLLALGVCWIAAGCGQSSERKTPLPPVEITTPAPAPADKTSKESIGSATMEQDGTLVLNLRAEGPGAIGDGRLVYRPGDKNYQEILAHVGPIEKGQTVPVRPWPEKK